MLMTHCFYARCVHPALCARLVHNAQNVTVHVKRMRLLAHTVVCIVCICLSFIQWYTTRKMEKVRKFMSYKVITRLREFACCVHCVPPLKGLPRLWAAGTPSCLRWESAEI